MIGRTLSHFRILAKLGEGGMGVVYRAEDTDLRRPVALKVLPPELVGNEERRLRFLREARAAAAVTHPNIATVYEIGEADGQVFIAMELVEGKTLRALLGGRPLPIKDALNLSIEIAEGLARAHEARVIHRDLKPDNVVVAAHGHAKILDFGLAKLLQEKRTPADSEMSRLETLSGEMTHAGRVFGTVAYMSPEQAKGEPADARSDLFSFGITLYEMVTGKTPFQGKTGVETLSAIIRDEPRPAAQANPDVSPELERILGKCLEKDPQDRYHHTDDLVVDLRRLKRSTDSGVQAVRGTTGRTLAPLSSRRRLLITAAVAAAALALFVVLLAFDLGGIRSLLAARLARGRSGGAPIRAFSQVTQETGAELRPNLSPDGRTLIYSGDGAGNADIYLLRVGGTNAINLTRDSPAQDFGGVFSPDGEQIAFRSEREGGGIFVMGATGESVRRLTDFGFEPSWSPAGTKIVFGTLGVTDPASRPGTSALWIVDTTTGERKQIFAGDAIQPHWSPHGDRIAFWSTANGQRDLWTITSGGDAPVPVTSDPPLDWNPVWSPDGGYLYFSSDRGGSMNVWRVPIEERTGMTLGPPEPATTPATYAGWLTFSNDGRKMAFAALSRTSSIFRVSFNPTTGTVEGNPSPVIQGSRLMFYLDVAPDGEWLVFSSWGKQEDLFLIRRDGTGIRQLTDDAARDRRPRWSPDGRRIAFYSNRGGSYDIWSVARDGSDLRQHTNTPDIDELYPLWLPDGARLLYASNTIFLIDAAKAWSEQNPEELPHPGDPEEVVWPTASSPDGSRFAVHLIHKDGSSAEGFIYSFASGKYEKLAAPGFPSIWLKDDQALLLLDGPRLRLLDLASRQDREIVLPAPRQPGFGDVDLSLDNRELYYIETSDESDIWLATLEPGSPE